jgi:hypothetical protein
LGLLESRRDKFSISLSRVKLGLEGAGLRCTGERLGSEGEGLNQVAGELHPEPVGFVSVIGELDLQLHGVELAVEDGEPGAVDSWVETLRGCKAMGSYGRFGSEAEGIPCQ